MYRIRQLTSNIWEPSKLLSWLYRGIMKDNRIIIWKIYFWAIVFLSGISYVTVGFGRIWEFVDLVIFVVAFLGLYGFCWQQQVISRSFWRAFFPAQLIWNIYYLYFLPLPVTVVEDVDMSRFLFGTVNFIPYIPLMMALFLYTYFKDEIWGE